MNWFQNVKFWNMAIAGQFSISDKFITDETILNLWKDYPSEFYKHF